MKVRGSVGRLGPVSSAGDVGPTASVAKAASVEPLEPDRAFLSAVASSISQVAPKDDVCMSKVDSIAECLRAGTYDVPAPVVASAVVDSMLPDDRGA